MFLIIIRLLQPMKFLLPIIISNRYYNLKKITLEVGRDREGE